jgi:uncharacterized repeat protein (TIGR02543 family)
MKKVVLFILASCAIVGAKVNPTAPVVKNGCYSISTADELYGFAAIVNGTLKEGRAAESAACGKLANDILANDTTTYYCGNKVVTDEDSGKEDTVYVCVRPVYESSGYKEIEVDPATIEPHTQWTPLKNFSGTFDGQGHIIWGLENTGDSTQNNLGFIASVVGGTETKPVVVRNLTFRKSELNGQDAVGGVVAKNSGYLLLDNVASMMQVRGRKHVASIVGRNEGSLSLKSSAAYLGKGMKFVGAAVGSNSGTIDIDGLSLGMDGLVGYASGVSHVGLVLGVNEKSAHLNAKNVTLAEGRVSADSLYAGFVGLNEKNAKISISTSSVSNDLDGGDRKAYVGGFVGANRGIVDIKNSYVRGNVPGIASGCFVGANEDSLSITNSYSICVPNEKTGDPIVGLCDGRVSLKNTFYKEKSFGCAKKLGAKSVTQNEVWNGVLAIQLHNYKGGDVWGQDKDAKDGWPKLNAAFGTYEFKLNLCKTSYYNYSKGGYSCSLDSTMMTYTYGEGVKQLPEYSNPGYVFLGWVNKNKPDSVVNSISKEVYGDIELYTMWEGDAVVPPQDSQGCYLISNSGELYGFGELLSESVSGKKCAKLTADIVVNKELLDSDGQLLDGNFRKWNALRFREDGVFDGQGHTISGLYAGSFISGRVQSGTLVIKNLGLINSYFIGDYSGAFVDNNEASLIIDSCFNASTVRKKYYGTGGFVGSNSGRLVISNSYNKGFVNGGPGLVGTNKGNLIIVNSFNEGPFTVAGSLVDQNEFSTTIVNSYNIGQPTVKTGNAKLVGSSLSYRTTTVLNSYYVDESMECPTSNSKVYSKVDNVYYVGKCTPEEGVKSVSRELFENGFVAQNLHNYVVDDSIALTYSKNLDGSVWGQKVGSDPLPVLHGKLVGVVEYSSSSAVSSSSGEANSSSSVVPSLLPVLPKIADGCYQIGTAQEMQGFAAIVNGTYGMRKNAAACGVLTANIDLDSSKYGAWEPIENFAGSLDGQGHTISNLGIDTSRYGGVASFISSVDGGTKDYPVVIKNIGWENATISATKGAAFIYTVKRGSYVKIDHAHNGMNFETKEGYTSAFVAVAEEFSTLDITYSYNTGDVNNRTRGMPLGCFVAAADGKVTLKNVYNAGGARSLVGSVLDSAKIINSYNNSRWSNGEASAIVDFCEENRPEIVIENSFYIGNSMDYCKRRSIGASKSTYADGSVAAMLHYYFNGSDYEGMEWGQNVGVDNGPNFSGDIVGNMSLVPVVAQLEIVSHSGDKTRYPRYYVANSSLLLPDPEPRKGYVFGGWFESLDSAQSIGNKIYKQDVGEKLTYYARWWPLPKNDGKCYKINSVDEVMGFSAIVNGGKDVEKDSMACGILTADVVLDSNRFEQWNALENFAGSLDGRGHSISLMWVASRYSGEKKPFISSINGGSKDKPVTIKNVEWKTAGGKFETSLILRIEKGSYVVMDSIHNGMDFGEEGNFVSSISQDAYLSIANSYNAGHFSGTRGYFIYAAYGQVAFQNVYNVGASRGLVGYAYDSVKIENSYSLADDQKVGFVFSASNKNRVSIVNSYYLDTLKSDFGGTAASAEEFANGTVAVKLRYDYDYDGSIWGQNVGVDLSPNFSKKIVGANDSAAGRYSVEMVSHDADATSYIKVYAKGVGAKLQDPSPKKGYAFGGWFDNPDYLGYSIVEITPSDSGDKKFYGKWWPLPKQNAGCYEIGSVGELFGFAAIVNGNIGAKKDSLACGKLVADIVFGEYDENWNALNLMWTPIRNFAGTFDGNGFAIKNMVAREKSTYYEKDSNPLGLFASIVGGSAEKPVVIKNLTVYRGIFNGGWNTGAIVGDIADSYVIMDSITVDARIGGEFRTGGIVGEIGSSTVFLTNSRKIFSDAAKDPEGFYYEYGVSGSYNVGGLIGSTYDDAVVHLVDNYVKDRISAGNNGIGSAVGIAGSGNVYISQFYAECDVYANSYVGGFVGGASGNVHIENSYHVGEVASSVTDYYGGGSVSGVAVGGFVGVNESSSHIHLVNSYHLGDVSARNVPQRVGGIIGCNFSDEIHIDNVFYPETVESDFPANAADSAMFADGSVAYALHNYDNGSLTGDIWGQKVGVDPYPVFTSKVDGYTTDKKISKLVLHTFEGDSIRYINHYTEGVVTPLPTVAREGHRFHGWFTEPEFLEDSLLYIDSTVTGDLELYAKLEIKKFAIIVKIADSDGCSGYVDGTGYYTYGSKVTLKVVPDPGCGLSSSYYFTPFDEHGVYVIDKVTQTDSLSVHFGKGVYDVSYYVEDDVEIASASEKRNVEDSLTLTIPSRSCYEFEGWFDNEKLEGEPVQGIGKGVYGNKKFWPKWKYDEACMVSSSSEIASSSSSSHNGRSSSSVVKSSSSVVKSSSSAKSSSSVVKSSSSNVKSSSSNVKSSSSSVKKKSSSSTVSLATALYDANVTVNVIGRNIQIDGAQMGSMFALFDMQGRMLLAGSIENGSRKINVTRAGAYLLRVGNRIQKLDVK